MALPPRLLSQPRAVWDFVGEKELKARSFRDDSDGSIEGFGRESRYGHVCVDPRPFPKKASLDTTMCRRRGRRNGPLNGPPNRPLNGPLNGPVNWRGCPLKGPLNSPPNGPGSRFLRISKKLTLNASLLAGNVQRI